MVNKAWRIGRHDGGALALRRLVEAVFQRRGPPATARLPAARR